MSDHELRNNIKVLRAKNDLTQEKLAELCGVTRVTINHVEKGKWVPSAVLAMRIARVFGVPFEEAFYFNAD